jgi:selenide,water dikinase
MMERLSSRHVVLLGIGHTNAHILRMWRMNPIPDTDLTCISNFAVATYSGMMPAVLAGQIARESMEIDLVRLCSSAGARLLTQPVVEIDHATRRVLFDDRPPVPFDVLSVGIGSTATRDGVDVVGESLVEIKPMQTFLDRLRTAVERSDSLTLRVCVVGGGVAGVEISTCLRGFMERVTDRSYTVTLLTSGPSVLPSINHLARRRVEQELQHRGIRVLTGSRVQRVTESTVELADGEVRDADLVIWATGATAPPLLDHLGLNLDERGFIKTDNTLQATSAANVFAVGDTGTIVGEQLPKAGVYAVRQGPVLWQNIKNGLDGRPLHTYRPQRSFLKLINLGDGRAVGAWKGLAFTGRSMMRW